MGSQNADGGGRQPPHEEESSTPTGEVVSSVAAVGFPVDSLPEGTMTVAAVPAISIEALIRDHHAALYRYAYRLCGSATDAEDIVQQTFMTVCRKLEQVREPQHVSAWLYAVLRSCFLKSRRKPQPLSVGNLEINLDQMPERGQSPALIDQDELQLALDELPTEYKLVVLMFYFEHCSYKEIAERLELPIGTVMSRLARGKARLRSRLGEKGNAESPLESKNDEGVRLAERAASNPLDSDYRSAQGLRRQTTESER